MFKLTKTVTSSRATMVAAIVLYLIVKPCYANNTVENYNLIYSTPTNSIFQNSNNTYDQVNKSLVPVTEHNYKDKYLSPSFWPVVHGDCPEGKTYVFKVRKCFKQVPFGGQCLYSEQCSGVTIGAVCKQSNSETDANGIKTCQCLPSSIPLGNGRSCVKKRACIPYLLVKENLIKPVDLKQGNCPPNMHCLEREKFCICQNGFEMNDRGGCEVSQFNRKNDHYDEDKNNNFKKDDIVVSKNKQEVKLSNNSVKDNYMKNKANNFSQFQMNLNENTLSNKLQINETVGNMQNQFQNNFTVKNNELQQLKHEITQLHLLVKILVFILLIILLFVLIFVKKYFSFVNSYGKPENNEILMLSYSRLANVEDSLA